jgi:hypothetical protein
MATDTTDPRIGLIVRIGILAIATLIGTRAGLVAYFDRMTKDEQYKKIGSLPTDALNSLRTDEKERLSSGSMSVDRSMQILAAKGRMGAGPDIMPSASKDIAPLQGWTQMPASVPAPMMAQDPNAAPSASSAPSAAPSASGAPSTAPSAAPSGAPSVAPIAPGHQPPPPPRRP